MTEQKIVGIVGATGLTGLQLISLLSRHRYIKKVYMFSRSKSGQYIHQLFPFLKGIVEGQLVEPTEENLDKCDTLFLALPHGESMKYVRNFTAKQIIDLGADFRIPDSDVFSRIYKQEHECEELIKEFAYGICELNELEIKTSQYISAPGCIATSILLAIYPLLLSDICENEFIIDTKVSSSGSGINNKSESNIHPIRSNSIRAYSLHKHRHIYEISHFIKSKLDREISLSLNTFSVDLVRGLTSTIYFKVRKNITEKELNKIYRKYYSESEFVRVFSSRTGYERYPNPKLLIGSNFCDIGISLNGENGVIVSALDNLIKGAAGQAIQNFNMINSYPINESLDLVPVYPV
ncbi:N-acetyl-gamma-glutamyl-phosphate reductase [Bacillus cereus]|uniref:N-acetyl-gamma-glutamyl-phosphate reductase n=1 Tax=Bacillus cereus TaxID=1396 RepID=UPI003980C31F